MNENRKLFLQGITAGLKLGLEIVNDKFMDTNLNNSFLLAINTVLRIQHDDKFYPDLVGEIKNKIAQYRIDKL